MKKTTHGNLMLFGGDYVPTRKTSEVNFWHDMVDEWKTSFGEIVILSVNRRSVPRERLSDNVILYNVPPVTLRIAPALSSDPEYTGKTFNSMPAAPLLKTLTFLHRFRFMEELIHRHHIGVVHYMRVFGLFTSLLSGEHPGVITTVTVPTHVDRGFPFHGFYHWFKNRAFKPMDRVVATTHATARRLRSAGLSSERIAVIPWATNDPAVTAGSHCSDIAAKYGLRADAALVLWAGPLQGTGRKEIDFALRVARLVRSQSRQVEFVFAFKPDRMPAQMRRLSGETGIRMLETNREQFAELLMLAQAFLSPVCNEHRTVAPPLTWIEVMSRGIPVLTTPVDGVDEIIDSGSNGLVAASPEEMARFIVSLDESTRRRLGVAARRTVRHRFDVRAIAARYIELWEQAGLRKEPSLKSDVSARPPAAGCK